MRVRGLIAVCAVLVLCGTPLASAMTDRSSRGLDESPPVITVPDNITTDATSSDGANVSFTVDFSDPDGIATSGCDHDSGSLFPIGTTTVTCNATDLAGNVADPASFNVTVNEPPPPPDTTPPTLSLPGNITAEATGPGGASVSFGVSATDDVDPSPSASCDHSSGTYGITTTTVSCTARDASNNSSSGSFTITVHDTTAPSISVPGTITVPASGSGGASVSFSVTASDAVDSTPTISCDHSSGSTFPVGTTTVSCSAKDNFNNTSSGSFQVKVQDQTAPTISVPSSFTVEATSSGGATVTFSVSASDAIDPSPAISCSPASGAVFPLGTTGVSCTATDASGNTSAPGTFNVTVHDGTPPTLSVPGLTTAEATSGSGAVVNFSATATDALDASPTVSCSPGSGATFALGNTTVSCTASDHSGNSSAPKTFTVRVQDTTAPVVSVPGTITTPAAGSGGAFVSYTVTASDAVDSSPAITCSKASGTMFPVGTTTVSCTAKDDANNTSAAATFDVKVQDQTAPTISVPASFSREATSTSGATVTFTVTATDAIDSSPTITCNPASGSTFPVGTTHVSCTARDDAGNTSAPGTFDVTVRDSTAPTLAVPGLTTAEATSGSGAVVNFTATATDALDASPTVSCSPGSGATFPLGNTTVSCTASDHSGNNSAAKTFTVKVQDTTAPTVSVPGPITAAATGASGAPVSFNVTASDAVDSSPTITCSKNSGSTFAVGTTHVSCTAKDDSNNTSAAAGFDVTVQDRTAPTISVPASFTREATSAAGALVTFTPAVTASDAIDATPTITCDHATGSTFPIGVTHVSCTAKDDAGNTSTPGTFDVTVRDSSPPTLTVSSNITTGGGPGGATVAFTVSATDIVDPSPTITCSKNSGDNFPLGTTTVSCTAKDSSNNVSAPKTFTVTILDRTPPTVSVPGPITKEATSGSGAAVSFAVTASDAIDPSPTTTCTPASGSTFPIGTTHVSCTGKDASNNTSAAATFDVNVVDTTDPDLINVPADITAEANGPSGSKVNYTPPTAVDLGTPIASVPCAPSSGSTFPMGSTTVNCSASDGHGNTGTATFKVKVVDTTPPTLIAPGDTSVYATSDSGADAADQGPITRFIFGFNVSDIADPSPKVTANSPGFFGVGTTTVLFTAIDASGNKSTASAKLTVLAKPAPGTTPPPLPPPADNKPPANVGNLVAKGGDARASFKWTNPSDADFDHTEIIRTTSLSFKAAGTGTVVYSGKATTFTDKGLQNGIEYRYVIASVDKNANKSAGVAIVVVPKKAFLKTPADGARLKQIPKQFVWLADPKAAYYNLQLYAGGTLLFKSTAADPKKILSTWTITPVFVFKSPWKWEGRTYKMAKGVYTWYVWPGYGAREAAKYGALMGTATFQLTPTPAKPKPKAKPKKKP
jgi:large repetitive protein